VLAAGRVARLEEVAAILQSIVQQAEKEERPQDSIDFLKSLARMLHDQRRDGPADVGAGTEPFAASNAD
jgi:hypothetical protein